MGGGGEAGMTEDCDPALSRMCPLSERERDRQRDRETEAGHLACSKCTKKTVRHISC